MRYHLLKTFDKIYILDLHGNTRKKETTPSGDKDDNVFDIMQGVSINIFVKLPYNTKSAYHAESLSACHTERSEVSQNTKNIKKSKNKDISHSPNAKNNLATIYHYDLYGKRKDKYDFLASQNLDSIKWQILNPQNPFYLFIPQNESLKLEYDKGWSVKDIFKISSVGVTTSRDKLCISDSDSLESLENFKNRVKRFMELDIESARNEFDLGEDTRGGWTIDLAQKELKDTGNNPANYVKIHYRPFDYRWTYYTGSNGFYSRSRGEVMQHFLHDFDNVGLIYKRGFSNTDSGQGFTSNSIIDFRS
mgnify:FL=1